MSNKQIRIIASSPYLTIEEVLPEDKVVERLEGIRDFHVQSKDRHYIGVEVGLFKKHPEAESFFASNNFWPEVHIPNPDLIVKTEVLTSH